MNQKYLEKLAKLAVRAGVNVQKGQTLIVNASVDAAPLARLITAEAYQAGAREVIVNFSDDAITRQMYLYGDEEIFTEAPAWKTELLNDAARKGAAIISIVDEDPDGFAGIDPARMTARKRAQQNAAPAYRNGMMNGTIPWCVIAAASPAWAGKVYPDLPAEEAVEALWNDIFAVSRIDDNDPLENWEKHNASFQKRISRLNDCRLKKLHYTNAAGTDLWVELPENYLFAGGGQYVSNGAFTFPNIPTEEVFSAPKKDGVNGVVRSTMPLNLNGNLVKDIRFTFKDGKIVDFDASSGRDLLEQQIDMDEGARYLGEIALVPYGSPIQKLGRVFYNTLIDENASCHFAFGSSYPECIPGGQNMTEEELLAHGLNQSHNHVDFMVGSDDLTITGYTEDGREIPVFVNGRFTEEFDGG